MQTKLKILRAEHNMTQEQLAKALGTSQKAISSWEVGTATPKPPMMQKIEDYFGVPKEDIFFTAFNYSN
ncbi:helix-turn-helix transcriptional regulator [Limosilactobacillus sp. STM2_1]|uniref:Helix-turn-helix transcriptional regulator n=1 Tax=Limosilactobacillus rudii TaxID=2759755 RepID=A0A7W3UK58_9LACO|nr:helix-turn-helix transcriptional regulator [Limosilactobacillus rudii]MBB1078924.1 helix-turn-helix transcriptional regulator [Limosilactobacillus rudii]MBB1097106.1 helix-turn-helix transcriptional regulator [Limosilactobacillus rudii]MCD7134100.1 helix-turn-helix domain-containing protein [Limosilactobacillus rudii]